MITYKISGTISEDAVIYIIQDGEYKGRKNVTTGNYEVFFESDSDDGVIAVAENADGRIISFGNIIPIEIIEA